MGKQLAMGEDDRREKKSRARNAGRADARRACPTRVLSDVCSAESVGCLLAMGRTENRGLTISLIFRGDLRGGGL